MVFEKQNGVPKFEGIEYAEKTKDYAVLIPIINGGDAKRDGLYTYSKKHITA